MKRIKLNLALIAMVLGCTVAFAFKAPVSSENSPQTWYYDNSGSTTDPANYTLTPDACPTGNVHICSIVADADPAHPAEPLINSGLASRISNKDTSMGDVFLKH